MVAMNGNQALALGIMAAGIEVCSMYPITPATSAILIDLNSSAELDKFDLNNSANYDFTSVDGAVAGTLATALFGVHEGRKAFGSGFRTTARKGPALETLYVATGDHQTSNSNIQGEQEQGGQHHHTAYHGGGGAKQGAFHGQLLKFIGKFYDNFNQLTYFLAQKD